MKWLIKHDLDYQQNRHRSKIGCFNFKPHYMYCDFGINYSIVKRWLHAIDYVRFWHESLSVHVKINMHALHFWRTHVLFLGGRGTCTPVLDFLWRLLWVSKPGGFCLIHFFVEANVMYIPWDPPLLLHTLTSWQLASQLVTSPHASAEVRLGLDSNGQSPVQKTNTTFPIAASE